MTSLLLGGRKDAEVVFVEVRGGYWLWIQTANFKFFQTANFEFSFSFTKNPKACAFIECGFFRC